MDKGHIDNANSDRGLAPTDSVGQPNGFIQPPVHCPLSTIHCPPSSVPRPPPPVYVRLQYLKLPEQLVVVKA